MTDTWVVNASPLITLAKVGHLNLLTSLAKTVLVPSAVAEEVVAGPRDDPARAAILGGFGQRVSAIVVPDRVIEWGLGPGESAVLATSLATPGSTAVLDDAQARAAARSLRLPLIGTLGVVVRAKRRGMIPAARPVFDALTKAGLHLDVSLLERLLNAVNE